MENRIRANRRRTRVGTFGPFGSKAEWATSRRGDSDPDGAADLPKVNAIARPDEFSGARKHMKRVGVRHSWTVWALVLSLSGFLMPSGTAFAADEGSFPLAFDSIGVVGCSNTKQHVEGYTLVSDADKFWPPLNLAISGGTLARWAANLSDTNPYWANFSSNLEQHGADAVWMQMCIRDREASSTGMTVDQQNDVTDVIGEIHRRTGGVPVYISPLNQFAGNDCTLTGPHGVSNAIQLADWASAAGLATRGPDTGPLEHSQLADDLCHLNETGLVVVGEVMVDYFDVVDLPDEPPVADFTYSPSRPLVNEQTTFQDLSTDDGTIVSWVWFFDGVMQTGQRVQVKFLQAGTHEVRLKVVDDDNNVAVTKKLVTVRSVTNR